MRPWTTPSLRLSSHGGRRRRRARVSTSGSLRPDPSEPVGRPGHRLVPIMAQATPCRLLEPPRAGQPARADRRVPRVKNTSRSSTGDRPDAASGPATCPPAVTTNRAARAATDSITVGSLASATIPSRRTGRRSAGRAPPQRDRLPDASAEVDEMHARRSVYGKRPRSAARDSAERHASMRRRSGHQRLAKHPLAGCGSRTVQPASTIRRRRPERSATGSGVRQLGTAGLHLRRRPPTRLFQRPPRPVHRAARAGPVQ